MNTCARESKPFSKLAFEWALPSHRRIESTPLAPYSCLRIVQELNGRRSHRMKWKCAPKMSFVWFCVRLRLQDCLTQSAAICVIRYYCWCSMDSAIFSNRAHNKRIHMHACRTAQNTLRLSIQPFFNYGCQRNATCECHFNYLNQIQLIQRAFIIRRCVWHYCIFVGPTVGQHSQAGDRCWHFCDVGKMCAISVSADMRHVRRSRTARCTLSMHRTCARPGDECECIPIGRFAAFCPISNSRFDALKAFASRHFFPRQLRSLIVPTAHIAQDPM